MKHVVSDVKSEKLTQELKDLETQGDDGLKDRWRGLYGTQPPKNIHRSLLIAAVAHRMQENALGALKFSVRRHLMQAANNPAAPRPSPHYPSLRPRVGTVLVRDSGSSFEANDTSHFPRLDASSPARAGRDRCSSASKSDAKEQNHGSR